MLAEDFQQTLDRKLDGWGYKGKIVSICRLREVQEALEGTYRKDLFDENFYQDWLSRFASITPQLSWEPQSILIISIPQPQYQITFHWDNRVLPLIVPPTYLFGKEIDKQVEDQLSGWLGQYGYRISRADLPKKLLAVRSSLGRYGRNNICYVEGMGSFLRLVAFYSDTPCEKDEWREPQMMDACRDCSACFKGCPTGAITTERFLLQAERCLVYHNEKDGKIPFPEWIDTSWHNCLVGCMLCQKKCPQDKDFWGWVEDGPEFNFDETGWLLKGLPIDQIPHETAEKLRSFDLLDLLGEMPRNLSVHVRDGMR